MANLIGVAMVDGGTWIRVLRTAAIALVVSAALAMLGQVVYVLSFRGTRLVDKLDLVSQIATPTLGVLVVGAAILLLAGRRARTPGAGTVGRDWVAVAIVVLGTLLALAAVYSVIRMVSVHVPSPGATGQSSSFALSSGDWSARVGQILLRGAGGLLGAWAAWAVLTTMALSDRVAEPSAPA